MDFSLETPPRYLADIIKSNARLILIYNQLSTTEENEDTETTFNQVQEDSTSSDLTGTPLEVDLAGDCSKLSLSVNENLWNDEECRHYPLELRHAREKINSLLCKHFKHEGENIPIYAICKGDDKKCTIILGAYQSIFSLHTTQIFFEGVYHQGDKKISLENMRDEHCRSVNSYGNYHKVSNLIRATYFVFGHHLISSYNLTSCNYSGSICYDISWNSLEYSMPDIVNSTEMTLQVLIGHNDSQLNTFWKHLVLLKFYTSLLLVKDSKLEEATLSNDPVDSIDILSSIITLLEETTRSDKFCLRTTLRSAMDIKNLRREELTDKLWNLLINCGTIGDLKYCLHSLFEVLATDDSYLKINIPLHNTSMIGSIIKGLSEGKMAVPTLSYSQALECLIELGIEKLKADYLRILSYFNCLSEEKVLTLWRSLGSEFTATSKNILEKENVSGASQRTRMTAHTTSEVVSISGSISTLDCLVKLHTACDVLLLASKYKCLHQSLVDKVANLLTNSEIKMNSKSMGYLYALFSVTVVIDSEEEITSKLNNPFMWQVRFSSSSGKSTVSTAFHHSLYAPFPSAIYNKYEMPEVTTLEPIYYITKMREIVHRLL